MATKSNQNNLNIKEKAYIILACIFGFLLVFILFPFLPKWVSNSPSFSESDMTGRWISVFMAFVFSTIVTKLLLNRQSESQLETKKQEKIYEEKLKMYKDFLESLGKIIEEGELEKKGEIQLRIDTASLAIHTSADRMKRIGAHVRDVVLIMCDKSNRKTIDSLLTYEQGEKISDERVRSDALLTNLMNISNCFREELYDDVHHDGTLINSMKEDFAKLFELANPGASDDSDQDDIDDGKNVAENAQAEGMEEESAVQISPNWVLKLGTNSTWKKLSLEPQGDKKWGEIYIRPWGERCAMVMRYLNAEGEAVKAFADEVKYWGFYRSNLRTVYGEWRNTLDDDQWCKKYDAQKLLSNGAYSFSQEIKSDEFLTRYEEDTFFRSHLESMLKRFVQYMEQYRRRCDWKELLSKYESDNDNLYIYPHITTLWCDYNTPTKDGFIRLSLNEETQNNDKMLAHVLISRYNADAAFDRLLDALQTDLNKSKEQLMQEANEKGHIRVDTFDFVMNEGSKSIDEEQTKVRAKDTFKKWHTYLKISWR